jgi:acyl-CoA synthetase (AMP-forming)/AMP-acid ligase II
MGVTQSRTTTLPDILGARVEQQPDGLAFRFLADGTTASAVDWTYGDLARHAAVMAAELGRRGLAGRRVVLALDPGLSYIASLFGIFQIGATAVPSFPPTGKRAVPRFVSIVGDCRPDVIVADPRYRQTRHEIDAHFTDLGQTPEWLFVDDDFFDGAPQTVAATANEIDHTAHPALLQYTSGSTGEPKGVVITHDNLVSNSLVLEANMGYDPDRVGCSWLPPYHDMGLIGTIVLAVFSGWPLVLMSPVHFVQHPYRWLKAITDYKVTISVSPNFALELAAASVTDDELATLDLSTLRQVYCGAEPVLPATLDQFRHRLAPCGYSATAMIPCYGMAEATLYVSGKPDGTAVRTTWVDKAALEHGVMRSAEPGADGASEIVSCGAIAAGHELLVVDPDTRRPLDDGHVGEIWLHGTNVAAGYYDKPDQTAETFGARLAGGDEKTDGDGRTFLRTGDLGFLSDGELYVTGRIKDLIILGGRNLHPQDIELSVRQGCDAVWGVAAFSVRQDGGERLVVVVDLMRGFEPTLADVEQVREDVVAAVTREHGVAPADVYVGPAGTIRHTTSGKVQRNATREGYLQETLRRLTLADDRGALTAL